MAGEFQLAGLQTVQIGIAQPCFKSCTLFDSEGWSALALDDAMRDCQVQKEGRMMVEKKRLGLMSVRTKSLCYGTLDLWNLLDTVDSSSSVTIPVSCTV